MVNYSDAKIYRVIDNSTGLQYIGSTTQPLSKRMWGHRNGYKRWVGQERPRGMGSRYTTSFELFETGNEVRIELIEKPEVTCREELDAREGYFIRELECINKNVAGRTRKEYREDNKEHIRTLNKEYYEVNKEMISERGKEYREANKEMIRAKDKEWREANREHCQRRWQKYYQSNWEEIRTRENATRKSLPKAVCEYCGCAVKHWNLKRHQRTQKCLAARAAKADPLIEGQKKWKQEHIRCEVCGATTTKGNYAQHKKAKYCLEAAAAKAEQGL